MSSETSQARSRRGFTIVELLVVIGIITVLIGLLLPSIGMVRRAGSKVKTQGVMNAVAAGLEAFRKDTGGNYPPSAGDATGVTSSRALDRVYASNPYVSQQIRPMWVTGANLLAWAMVGADLLGSPGFKDINRNGYWADDTNMVENCANNQDGLYALDRGNCPNGSGDLEPYHSRLPAYIDVDKDTVKTMLDLAEDALQPPNPDNPVASIPLPAVGSNWGSRDDYVQQLVLVDGFGFPILYYRANPGASRMTTDYSNFNNPVTGSYDIMDNSLYTGAEFDGNVMLTGIDLGGGNLHELRSANSPGPNPAMPDGQLMGTTFEDSLARFLWDRKVTARNVSVRKDSYLLLSPGYDGLWGNEDDIGNFQR